MKFVGWVAIASLLSAAAAIAIAGVEFDREIVFGMAGPLAVVAASWLLIDWMHRRRPASVTALMMGAFAGKMIVFAAYVAVMLKGLGLRPGPFAASFVSYFIALYFVQALALRRLSAGVPASGIPLSQR